MSIIEEGAKNAPAEPLLEEDSEPPLIDIGYPLPLISIESTVKSQTKLTASEFWALQNIWSHIKSRWHRYAMELYIEFYTKNHDHINKFRSKKSGKICVIVFSEHAKTIFQLFREVIENGIQNWDKSANRINDMSKSHICRSINLDDIDLMAAAFKELILRKCDGIITPTVRIALDKLFNEFFEKQKSREMLANDDASIGIDIEE